MILIFFFSHPKGNESVYKSVTAKALEPSQVIRLPMKALKEVFHENPGMGKAHFIQFQRINGFSSFLDMLIRVVQIIMIRLQRVIFTALRNYLGLYSELVQMKPPHKDRRPQPIPPTNLKASPTHHKRRPSFDVNISHTLSVEASDFVRPDIMNDLSEVRFMSINSNLGLIKFK